MKIDLNGFKKSSTFIIAQNKIASHKKSQITNLRSWSLPPFIDLIKVFFSDLTFNYNVFIFSLLCFLFWLLCILFIIRIISKVFNVYGNKNIYIKCIKFNFRFFCITYCFRHLVISKINQYYFSQ